MEIRRTSFNYPKLKGEGPQGASTTISFPRRVLRVTSGVSGYSARFENGDHHLGRLIVESNARIDPDDDTRVVVSGSFGLRDWSGNWDDHYSGNIQVAVLAELEAIAPPAPGASRSDLIVLDTEHTQAIQHFRSAEHLDAPNVFADNSIRLVEGKPAVVRVLVDYDNSSSLPAISWLNGELDVTSGGTTTVISPLEWMRPRRAVSIDRGNRQHTMNFLIPEALCQGTVQMSIRVFDAWDNSQFSAPMERELRFETFPTLPVMAVGINYTGPDTRDGDLAAPLMADFVDLFGFTEATYPIPGVQITSYVTMDYDAETISDIGEGCDRLSDMKDAVADLRGDSDDIVYGLFNTGVDTGSVGGCGGGGVAVGRIAAEETAAHEVGHALGRKHAPCDNVTRCAEPRNTDDGYPSYSGYDSDSIGEYGFDPRSTNGAVRGPGGWHDFMGYSGGRWISPYTYKALMSRIPETFAAGASAFASSGLISNPALGRRSPDGEWLRVKQPKLFLRLVIHRDRSVSFHPAFHFDALPRAEQGENSDFLIELVDAKGNVLRKTCLFVEDVCCGCGCASGPWPVRIRQAVSFHPDAKKLVLYECDKVIGTWPVTDPPALRVAVSGTGGDGENLNVRWEVTEAPSGADLWYLIQWRDRYGTWRGAAPRTQENHLEVPKRLFRGQKTAAIRVLATAGIATGRAHWEGSINRRPPPESDDVVGGAEVDISITGIPARTPGSYELPALIATRLLHLAGETVPASTQRWYDQSGAEIGRGRTLDLRALAVGEHLLTATVLETGLGIGSATWHVERTQDGRFLLHVGDRKGRAPGDADEDRDSPEHPDDPGHTHSRDHDDDHDHEHEED